VPESIAPVPAKAGVPLRLTVWRYAVRLFLVLVFALPLLFMLVSSLKPDTQILGDLDSTNAFLPVGDGSPGNDTAVVDRVPFRRFVMNSIMITVLTVVLGLVVNSGRAFALARLRFRGQDLLLGVIQATLILLFETLALPLLWWVNIRTSTAPSAGWTPTRSGSCRSSPPTGGSSWRTPR
jgi:multiple sugar transport system permease protein